MWLFWFKKLKFPPTQKRISISISWIFLNIWANELGIMPLSSGFDRTPSIVKVFPVPVWPYATTVPLYPSNTKPTIGLNIEFSRGYSKTFFTWQWDYKYQLVYFLGQKLCQMWRVLADHLFWSLESVHYFHRIQLWICCHLIFLLNLAADTLLLL